MSDIAYVQVDGWGVVGESVFRVTSCAPAAFLGLDDIDDPDEGSGMLLGVEALDVYDQIALAQLSDEDRWRDRIGTTYFIEVPDPDPDNRIPAARYTLRGYVYDEGTITHLLFHAGALAESVPTFSGSTTGILTEEDHWRFCTRQPTLDLYVPNHASARAQVGPSTSIPLLPMGRVTLSRWMPILSDFSQTLGARLVLEGGLAPADGMSVSIIRDRDYEDRYSRIFATLLSDDAGSLTDQPLLLRRQTLTGRRWVFTNELPDTDEDPTDPDVRSAIPYHPASLCGVDDYDATGPRKVLQAFPSSGGLVDQNATISTGTDAIVMRRNPVAYYDAELYSRYPAPLGVVVRTPGAPGTPGAPYSFSCRAMWVGSELMQATKLKTDDDLKVVSPRTIEVRRGLLNTTIQTHATQSEWFTETPYISGQRLRVFIAPSSIGSVFDRDEYVYTGYAVDAATDESQAQVAVDISTDFVSIYASRNAGSETTQAQTITGDVLSLSSSPGEPNEPYRIRPVYSGIRSIVYTTTAALYSADEVYIRLCRRESNEPVDADWLHPDGLDGNDDLYERNHYFWRWVHFDGHYVRCADDYLRYPMWAYDHVNNPLRPQPYVHLPQFVIDTYDGGNLAFVAHTPVPWAVDRVQDDSDEWLWGNLTRAAELKAAGIVEPRTNAIVTKTYDADSFPRVDPIEPSPYDPANQDQISYFHPPAGSSGSLRGTAYKTILSPFLATDARSAGTADLVNVAVPTMHPPRYQSATTGLGHVMESESVIWRAWTRAQALGNDDPLALGQHIYISPIEAILQFLCSTGTGLNNITGYTGIGAAELSGLGADYNGEPVDVRLDVLPAGLGLGIPIELIDLRSFLSLEFGRRARGMPYAVRNLAVTADQASSRVQVLDDLLKATYLTLTTDTRGRIRLASSLSKNFVGSVDNEDLALASPTSAPACETSVETENIVESVQLTVPRTYLGAGDNGTIPTANSFNSGWSPAPRGAPALLRVENDALLGDADASPLVHPIDSRLSDALRSTLFRSIQSRPTEVTVDLEVAGAVYYVGGSYSRATNDRWTDAVSVYLSRFSRLIQVRRFEVIDHESRRWEVGDIVVMFVDVFPNATGREDAAPDATPCIIRQVSVDRRRGVRSIEAVVLLDPIPFEGTRWSAAASVSVDATASTDLVVFPSFYLRTPYSDPDQLRGRENSSGDLTFHRDIDVFREGDVISIYDQWLTHIADRTIVSLDPDTNTITVDTTVTAPRGSQIALANLSTQTPDPTPSSAASYFGYQSTSRWRNRP